MQQLVYVLLLLHDPALPKLFQIILPLDLLLELHYLVDLGIFF